MAFTVDVAPHILDASADCSNAGSMGHRGDGTDGSREQQRIGIIGQNVLYQAIGRGLMAPNEGFDGGVDFTIFGLTFDVKTVGRAVPPRLEFVNNVPRSQVKFNVDCYLFLSFNKTVNKISVCGWLPKDQFLERAILYDQGTVRRRSDSSTFEFRSDTYEITNNLLYHRATNWPELWLEFHQISVKEFG